MVQITHTQGSSKFSTLSDATSKQKDEVGSWKLETQIEKINGTIEIGYTYVVSNNGEQEYIGTQLNNELNVDGKTYLQIAAEIKEKMKNSDHYSIGTYVGTRYYTGNIGSNDKEVGVKFKIEDYLNNAIATESSFTRVEQDQEFYIYDGNNPSSKKQKVDVLQTNEIELNAEGQKTYKTTLKTTRDIDATSTNKNYTFRSYAAQLVPSNGIKTSRTGTLDKSSKLGNLKYIQGDVGIQTLSEIINMDEQDEFIAESVIITVETGADQKSPILLIVSITGGLVLIAVGIVLIKKFVIK